MPLWIRTKRDGETTVSATNADVVGDIILDDDGAPGDFDPTEVNSVRFIYRFTFNNPGNIGLFTPPEHHICLNETCLRISGGSIITSATGATQILDNDSPRDVNNRFEEIDSIDNSPSQSFSTAQWEDAVFSPINTQWTEFVVDMGGDGITVILYTSPIIRIEIDYGPTNYIETSTDDADVTDATPHALTTIRSVTDDVGATDNVLDDLVVPPTVETEIRPVSDISAGWDTAPTGSQPLWEQLDEETPSDTDYIFTVTP